jgi:hypothetical protein
MSSNPEVDDLPALSDGEVHYLWHFIQGAIMVPETRIRLRRAWGMCPRHSFAALAVEAAFRHTYLHGPAVLYEDLMDRAVRAFGVRRPGSGRVVAHRLREQGPCMMCEMGFGPQSTGLASENILRTGRQFGQIRAFVRSTVSSWSAVVCGRCAGNDAWPRCRTHLREDLVGGRGSLPEQRLLVQGVADHVSRYARSFRWEFRGSDTGEDRAALISAVGWCSGWKLWLLLNG